MFGRFIDYIQKLAGVRLPGDERSPGWVLRTKDAIPNKWWVDMDGAKVA
jgi:hypothetical protein